MISRKTIDEIFSVTRVEEVVGEFVQLKKSGSNYKGLSPFSDERTPSFMVSPAKQIWKDFSSGKGGNAVTFLMEHEQFTYPEALRWLAKRYQITIEEDEKPNAEEIAEAKTRENQYTLTEFAKKYFVEQLYNTEEGQNVGLSYFQERGFRKDTLQKFELGYSPKQADAFVQHALSKGYTYDQLSAVGFAVGQQERPIDRFRERVMFPIHSFSGRTLGFGGRILGNHKKTAKYLNSPENEIYHKSKILYGIYQAKQAILKKDECILVEGYTDVISLHQSGIQNVVASSGTALTPEQIRLVKRLTQNITLIYDGDPAGIKASFRGIDLILEQELNVKIVLLPEGEDPDSFAQKKSSEQIDTFLKENATDFIRFKTKVLEEEAKNDPVKKSALLEGILESIALIPNLLQRELYVRDTSSALGIREEVLFRQLAQILKDKQSKRPKPVPAQEEDSPLKVTDKDDKFEVDQGVTLEDKLISLMLQYGDEVIKVPVEGEKDEFVEVSVIEEVIKELEQDNISFSIDLYSSIYNEIKEGLIKENELRNHDYFIKHTNSEISEKVIPLIFDNHKLSDWDSRGVYVPKIKDNLLEEVQGVVLMYKRLVIKRMIQALSEKSKKFNLSSENEFERESTLKELIKLTQIKKKLDSLSSFFFTE